MGITVFYVVCTRLMRKIADTNPGGLTSTLYIESGLSVGLNAFYGERVRLELPRLSNPLGRMVLTDGTVHLAPYGYGAFILSTHVRLRLSQLLKPRLMDLTLEVNLFLCQDSFKIQGIDIRSMINQLEDLLHPGLDLLVSCDARLLDLSVVVRHLCVGVVPSSPPKSKG